MVKIKGMHYEIDLTPNNNHNSVLLVSAHSFIQWTFIEPIARHFARYQ